MAAILVDYENVNGSNGLKGADTLCQDDVLIIFYSECCGKIRYDYMQEIKESGCEFRIIKLKKTGKNALDFYIAAECGILSEKGHRQIAIISNDKGFQAVIDFFEVEQKSTQTQIVKSGNIEDALVLFSEAGDVTRRKIIQRRKTLLDLAVEYTRIEERNKMREELQEVLNGSGYEERTAEIIDFLDIRKYQNKKALYTGSLHCFGRRDGTAIYKLIKNKMEDGKLANG